MSGAAMPPPGYLANEDRGPDFFAFILVMTLVPIFAVGFRFWSRSMVKSSVSQPHRFWWDDWAALAALPLIVGNQVMVLVMIRLGFGKHIWNVPPANLVTSLKILFPLELLYGLSISIAKASALLFYSRVFQSSVSPRWFNMTIAITHAMNILWFIGNVLALCLICRPIEKSWYPEMPGKCSSTGTYLVAIAIPHLVIDLIILISPLPMIWKLGCGRGRKLALTTVFLFGYSTVVVTMGRVVTVLIQKDALTGDVTYAAIPIYYWMGAEIPMTLLCVCLPAMSHLALRAHTGVKSLASKLKTISSSGRAIDSKSSRSSDDEHFVNSYAPGDRFENGKHRDKPVFNSLGYSVHASSADDDGDFTVVEQPCRQSMEHGKIYVDNTIHVAQAGS